MRRNLQRLALPLLGVIVLAGWMYARPEAAATLTAEDAHGIRQLYATMYQGSDFRDADLWLSTFADDGLGPTGSSWT